MQSRKVFTHKNRGHKNRGHKNMRGGNYTSASTYGTHVNGTVDSQLARNNESSGYLGAQGQGETKYNFPTDENLSLIQRAGRRRKNKKSRRSIRGGFFGEVIKQAIVPFGLLGLQQTYRKKGKSRKHTHKRRR